MALHAGDIPIDEAVVRALLAEQRPEWAGRPLTEAGSGTGNVMFRLGDDLLAPRSPSPGPSSAGSTASRPRPATSATGPRSAPISQRSCAGVDVGRITPISMLVGRFSSAGRATDGPSARVIGA